MAVPATVPQLPTAFAGALVQPAHPIQMAVSDTATYLCHSRTTVAARGTGCHALLVAGHGHAQVPRSTALGQPETLLWSDVLHLYHKIAFDCYRVPCCRLGSDQLADHACRNM
jgi:hypothetical protein